MARDDETILGLKLDEQCSDCYGQGTDDRGDRDEPCEACEGRGRVLSQTGQTLLAFLERWLEVRLDGSGPGRLWKRPKVES